MIGPTGDFPQGKLNESDEGELKIAVGIQQDKIVIHFAEKISWIGLGITEAKVLVGILISRIKELEGVDP